MDIQPSCTVGQIKLLEGKESFAKFQGEKKGKQEIYKEKQDQ